MMELLNYLHKGYRLLLFTIICVLFTPALFAQYYLRGEVLDEKGNKFSFVMIHLQSKGNYPFSSGGEGVFGIPLNKRYDSITLIMSGYDTLKQEVDATQYQVLKMRLYKSTEKKSTIKLSSHTKNWDGYDKIVTALGSQETYTKLIENDVVESSTSPETGFSLNIDRASYSNIRRYIHNGIQVPYDAVRIEEMLNYFDFKSKDYTVPSKGFNCRTKITNCPWNDNSQLLYINLDAPKLNLDSVPPSNLVFLIDVSGSMEKPNRLPLLQSAFKLLVENLREKDVVTIVVYGGTVRTVLSATSGSNKQRINNVIDSLYADGETPGEGAIRKAYAAAKASFIRKGNNRVILATDGDFNVGQTSEEELQRLVEIQKSSGIYLTCIGVGMGDYKDSKLETLAKAGNGNFAYIDDIKEAEKVLVTEFSKTIFNVANDAYVDIKFNKDLVKNYRLIGFDNRKDAIEDHGSDLEGGDIGSGHTVMAIFEITRNAATIKSSDSLIANVSLRYLDTQNNLSKVTQQFSVINNYEKFENIDPSYRFATAVVMFGSLLRNSKHAMFSLHETIAIAKKASTTGKLLWNDCIGLMEKSEKIYNSKKKLF